MIKILLKDKIIGQIKLKGQPSFLAYENYDENFIPGLKKGMIYSLSKEVFRKIIDVVKLDENNTSTVDLEKILEDSSQIYVMPMRYLAEDNFYEDNFKFPRRLE